MNRYGNQDWYQRVYIFAETIEKAFVSVAEPIQENGRKIMHDVVISNIYDLFVLPNIIDYVSTIIENNENQCLANCRDNYTTI